MAISPILRSVQSITTGPKGLGAGSSIIPHPVDVTMSAYEPEDGLATCPKMTRNVMSRDFDEWAYLRPPVSELSGRQEWQP